MLCTRRHELLRAVQEKLVRFLSALGVYAGHFVKHQKFGKVVGDGFGEGGGIVGVTEGAGHGKTRAEIA